MARIRIVDAWLRSPASQPTHRRAVLVVADKWAEQRVLLRAFANCPDQTRPTIALHGAYLAIGPAGVDAHGSWGIHVEPPVDGRAQDLRAQLELAARRLAGSKGSPPRLVDEVSHFDGTSTQHWAPGQPSKASPPPSPSPQTSNADASAYMQAPPGSYYEPSESGYVPAALMSGLDPARVRNGAQKGWSSPLAHPPPANDSVPVWSAPSARGSGLDVQPRGRNVQTLRGFAPGPGAFERTVAASENASENRLAGIIRKTMPAGFQLDEHERAVLDALGQSSALSAVAIASITGTADGAAWMHAFMTKLSSVGLDIITHGGYVDGDAMYLLQH